MTRTALPAYLPTVGRIYDVCGSRGNGQIRITNLCQDGKGWLVDARVIHGIFSSRIHVRGPGDLIVTRVGELHWLPRLPKTEECDSTDTRREK